MKQKYLTKKEAIRLCKELRQWVADTGKHKCEWPGWGDVKKEYGPISSSCLFCHYTFQRRNADCHACPFHQKYGHFCDNGPHPYTSDPVGFNTMIQAIKP